MLIYWYFISVVSLTHWGRVTYICVSKLDIIGSDNIWTNTNLLLIGPLGTNLNSSQITSIFIQGKGLEYVGYERNSDCFVSPSNTLSLNKIIAQWRHNEHDGVSNGQPHDCLLKRFFMRRSKKTSKLRVTGLCEGNSPVTGEFPAQMPSNPENVSIWWRHHTIAHFL